MSVRLFVKDKVINPILNRCLRILLFEDDELIITFELRLVKSLKINRYISSKNEGFFPYILESPFFLLLHRLFVFILFKVQEMCGLKNV